ncbi:MAG: hypothetical protein NVS3B21_30650 [Acidimicrobiales bacterium]
MRLNREERRRLILDAAAEVFGRLGFEAARMEDVAKAAGIAKGLLYKHFSSKDALFQALIDRQAIAYAAELRSALDNSDVLVNPKEALRSGLAFWLGKVGDEQAPFNVTDPGAHDAYDNLRASLREVIAESIRAADPSTPEPYPRLLGALIQGAAENLGFAWRSDPGDVTPEAALAFLADFCWGGLLEARSAARPD